MYRFVFAIVLSAATAMQKAERPEEAISSWRMLPRILPPQATLHVPYSSRGLAVLRHRCRYVCQGDVAEQAAWTSSEAPPVCVTGGERAVGVPHDGGGRTSSMGDGPRPQRKRVLKTETESCWQLPGKLPPPPYRARKRVRPEPTPLPRENAGQPPSRGLEEELVHNLISQ